MATTVYDTEDIVLRDGTEIALRPNSIKYQKKFMTQLESSKAPKSNNEATDQIVALAVICLEGIVKDKAEDLDWVEENLDEPTVYKIIEVCGGIKLNDPNLLAAAVAMTKDNQEDGTA